MNDRNIVALLGRIAGRRQMIAGAAAATFGGLAVGSVKVSAGAAEEISHSCETIHQEVVFKASRKRVYEALTDAKQFEKVVKLSAAMKSGMAPGSKPAEISREVGGAFALFGGYVTGRHIELVPNERIIQAWRAGSWDPGVYSIARFEFSEQGSGTKLVFDHTGFPGSLAQHLIEGWNGNYWEPLEKSLA